MFTSLKRIIGLGWQNLVRDGGIAVANIFIMMIPIFLVSSIFLLKDVSRYMVDALQAKADISVYFNENTNEDDILRIKQEIAAIPQVNEVKYVSKDQALADFTERHKDSATLMESLQQVNGNPFLASLNIAAEGMSEYDQVAQFLNQDQYKAMVNKVNYSEKKSVIEKIFFLTAGASKAGLILAGILGFVSILVTFNTIRMAIINRKREIAIQRLVGASRVFIRGQFFVEGLIFGLLAAIFCFLITAGACWYANSSLEALMPGLSLWNNLMASVGTMFLLQLATGTVLGIISSMIATTRYLKV
ncbi:MAG: permease-like cell division protein FtsX [Candidatus Nealsonbacteria bacterium]|nr:permease-like cell division protein FtsX [Candidatus Nealsonbacteria bacterium]